MSRLVRHRLLVRRRAGQLVGHLQGGVLEGIGDAVEQDQGGLKQQRQQA